MSVCSSSGVIRRSMVVACVAASLLCSTAGAASPTPLVDQAFEGPDTGQANINLCCKFVAQTFTAGRDGLLAGVNIETRHGYGPPTPLRVGVRDVRNGVPADTALTETVLPSDAVSFSQLITFPQRPVIRAGVKYAIVVNLEIDDTSAAAVWSTARGDRYPRGEACGKYKPGELTGDWFCYTPAFGYTSANWFDNLFRTYLTPLAPTSKDDCKANGWRQFGSYRNQGDCVSSVATGGRNEPAGPAT